MKGAMGEYSAKPSRLVPMVMGVPSGGGGGGGGGTTIVSRPIVNQLNDVGTAELEPKLVERTPALPGVLKTGEFTREPRLIHLVSSLEFRRYSAFTVLVENFP